MLSIFCLNSNLNALLNKIKKNVPKNINNNIENNETTEQNNLDNIGLEVSVKITKINFNEQNIIVIGKII